MHSCPHCSRMFADSNGLFCHVNARHGRKAARVACPDHPAIVSEAARIAKAKQRAARASDEPSMADLVIAAALDRAMGLPVDRDIAEMFDV